MERKRKLSCISCFVQHHGRRAPLFGPSKGRTRETAAGVVTHRTTPEYYVVHTTWPSFGNMLEREHKLLGVGTGSHSQDNELWLRQQPGNWTRNPNRNLGAAGGPPLEAPCRWHIFFATRFGLSLVATKTFEFGP